MEKKPAISTQLKNAKAENSSLQAKVIELEKKLKDEASAKDRYYSAMKEAEAEIEQVHALLDVLPGAAGRKTEHEESWNQKNIKTMTRLAAYLATRSI